MVRHQLLVKRAGVHRRLRCKQWHDGVMAPLPSRLRLSLFCLVLPSGSHETLTFAPSAIGVSALAERCMREKRLSSTRADCSGSKVTTGPRQDEGKPSETYIGIEAEEFIVPTLPPTRRLTSVVPAGFVSVPLLVLLPWANTVCVRLALLAFPSTQAKLEVMAEEAASAEQSALAALREVEEIATSEELSRVTAELEWERREAEMELKRQLHVSEKPGTSSIFVLGFQTTLSLV